MKKDVLISIRGTVSAEGAAPDVIELVTEGRYYNKEGSYFISYAESEATGFGGSTTTLRVEGDDRVTLTRRGRAATRLVLERGRRHLCQYDTGEGQLLVGVSDCRILSSLGDSGGELTFNYSLDINSSLVSKNEVYISVREARSQVC
jgi:uncharacterized beta-barrel protein YwiB (DUF1934 family)